MGASGPEVRAKKQAQAGAQVVDCSVHPIDFELVSAVVETGLPGLDPRPVRVLPCMVTYTPDDRSFVGRPNDDPRLLVGGGGSGHAFKHAAGIGELLAQMASNETPLWTRVSSRQREPSPR